MLDGCRLSQSIRDMVGEHVATVGYVRGGGAAPLGGGATVAISPERGAAEAAVVDFSNGRPIFLQTETSPNRPRTLDLTLRGASPATHSGNLGASPGHTELIAQLVGSFGHITNGGVRIFLRPNHNRGLHQRSHYLDLLY